MAATSVKAPQLRPDSHLFSQDAGKHPALGSSFEAGRVAAGVGAAAGLCPAGHEHTLASRETEQIALRRRPAAAGAAPHGLARYDSASAGASTSIGIPSVSSASVAICGWGTTVSR
jgi:hypothetical protein